ncbi:MAG TPA: tRNA preQ1(34) S-adenosylmethionine ribosyltransferase-isomerase QueA [Rhodocyclaceae bacterium]|nr:tRNA preQ1(34) S-adenosylmethionine ribosyltransferase-isomerase QueA [Rhodocyclaceae bacterium]
MPLTLDDFDYSLPPELIAQAPLPVRGSSRLLTVAGELIEDRRFGDLTELIGPGDLLVINDTRVLHARLFGVKDSGGRVEVLVERILGGRELLAQVRASKPPRAGSKMRLEEAVAVEVVAREGEFYRLRVDGAEDVAELLERHGRLPLPPYIERAAADADEACYQTVYSRERGSVAAPTAGLHFDQAMIEALRARGCAIATVTLHVGAGTFQPVRVQDLSEHHMHSERYRLPQQTVDAIAQTRSRGGRVVAVGTTTLRTLESAALAGGLQAGEAETDLFILPGFTFRVVDALITNFHLPKSTLLMLVSAFGGLENLRRAYAHAIAHNYRFFSYGDAMLLARQRHEV